MLFGYTLRYSKLKHKKSVAELVVRSRTIYVSGYILQSDPAAASCSYTGIYCIRSCNNFCLIIVVRENDLSGQTYLYKIIYRHSQILPNTSGTLRSAECPRNIERITSSKIFSLGVVYSKLLGGKSRIVKLVREMKKKIGSFTWAILYIVCLQWGIIMFVLLSSHVARHDFVPFSLFRSSVSSRASAPYEMR